MVCMIKLEGGLLKGWAISENLEGLIRRAKNDLISTHDSEEKQELNQAMLELVRLENNDSPLTGREQLTQHYFLLME